MLIFSTKKDEYGNAIGFDWAFNYKGKRERAHAGIDRDVRGLNQVLEYKNAHGGETYFDKLPELMAGCSESAIDLAKDVDLSTDSIEKYKQIQHSAIDSTVKFGGSLKTLGSALKGVGKSLLAAGLNMGISLLVSKGLELAFDAFDKWVNRVQYANEALEELGSNWEDISTKQQDAQKVLSEYADDYNRLSKGVNTQTGENISLNESEYQRYLEANNAIANSALANIEGVTIAYDEQGNALVRLTGSTQTLADAYDMLAQKTRDEILGSAVMKSWNTQQESGLEIVNKYSNEKAAFESAFADYFSGFIDKDALLGAGGVVGDVSYALGLDYYAIEKRWQNSGAPEDIAVLRQIVVEEMEKAYSEAQSALNDSLDLPRRLASTVVEDVFANDPESYEKLNDSVQRMLVNTVDNLDYTYFVGKSDKELKDAVRQDFLVPLTEAGAQTALSELNKAQSDFQQGDLSYGNYLKQGQATRKALTDAGANGDYITSLMSYMGLDGESVYDNYVAHLGAIVKDANEEWLRSRNRYELEFANELASPQGEAYLSMEDFSKKYNKTLQEQALSVDKLSESYVALTEAQSKAHEIMQAVGTDGAMTLEQYKELIAMSPDYAKAVSGESGYFTVDYEKMRQINLEKTRTQQADVQKSIELNEQNYRNELKTLQELVAEYQSYAGESEEWRANKYEEIVNSKDLIDSYTNQRIELHALASEMEYATSSYKRWLDAQDAAEKSDGFKGAKSAIEAIREGDKSGRKNTEKYKAAEEYILGAEAANMTQKARDAALKRAESFYDKDGNFALTAWQKASLDVGAQDKSGKWLVSSIDEYAKLLGLSQEYTAQAVLALSEYNGSFGVDVSQALIDQAKGVLPETELDANTQSIMNLTEAILANTSAIKGENDGADKTDEGRLKELGYDPSQTVFGNIDTNNRQVINWDQERLNAAKELLEAWGHNPAEMLGTSSTVLGAYGNYDNVDIAYSPLLQTDAGAKLLSPETVDAYIFGLLDKLGDNWAEEDLLAVDKEGLEVDGEFVRGLIAGMGKEAASIAEAMHYTGKDGAIAQGESPPSESTDDVNIVAGSLVSLGTEAGKTTTQLGEVATAAGDAAKALSEIGSENDPSEQGPSTEDKGHWYDGILNFFGSGTMIAGEWVPKPQQGASTTEKEVIVDTSGAEQKVEELDKEAGEPVTKKVSITPTIDLTKLGNKTYGLPLGDLNMHASGTQSAPGGPSLVGEEDPEIVVNKKKGKWFLAKNPQLVNLNKGDIVYNGKQTRNILRGRGATGGNSYAAGVNQEFWHGGPEKTAQQILEELKKNPLFVNSNGSGGATGGGGKSSGKNYNAILEKFAGLYDWIQRALEVAQKKTQQLIDNVKDYVGYIGQNNALDKAIASTIKEREKNEAGYLRYMQQAEEVRKQTDLSDDLVNRIQNGTIDIAEYDDVTKKKIEEYQRWYELAEQCKDTIDELNDQERELSMQKLDNIIADYENRIDVLADKASKQQDEIELRQAKGMEIQESVYTNLINNAQRQFEMLTQERNTLEGELLNQVASGVIKEGSEEWHKYRNELEEIDASIIECQISMAEFGDSIYQLRIDKLSNVLGLLQQTQAATESLMSLHDAQGVDNVEGYYSILIGNGFEQIENLEKQNELLREQMEGLDVNSEKYQEILSEIESNEQAISDVKISQEQWNDAIADLKIGALEDERETLQEINDEYQKQLEYEEALEALEKAKNQRTKLVFREGVGFRYEADQDAIDAAQKRLDDLDIQAKLDAIDKQIENIEDNKANDNVYTYSGNTLANGLEIGSAAYYDMIEKMINSPVTQEGLVSTLAAKTDALNAASKNVSVSIGDVNVSGVDNVEALAKDIVTQLPNSILQELYKK